MANYIVNLFGNFCELFIILYFLKDYYKPRLKKQRFIPLCAIFTVFQFLNTNIFLTKSSLVAIGSIIFVLFILLLYNLKWSTRIIFLFFLYAIIAFSELIIGMILSMLFDINVSFIQNNLLTFATGTVTSKFLAYFFVLLTKKKKITSNDSKPTLGITLLFLLPLASFLVMLLFIRGCYQIMDTAFEVITLVASIILALANVAVFYIIDKQNELITTKEKLLFAEKHINNQVVHYQELYKHQNELRIFRHDIRNRLLSLIGLIKENETEKALQTMESSLDWLDQKANNIVNSGNPVIDAIIQSKLHSAKDKGITIDIFIRLSEKVQIDELELGIVLGNALDNAIEAVENSTKNQNKHIELKIITTADRISISVKNPVEYDFDTNNLSTSKSNKELHGYGIRSIQTIAHKYDGIVLFSCENKFFSININLGNHPIS